MTTTIGRMKIPSAVVWQLTKRWNSHLVTFNGQQFSHDPLSLTGFHNASQSGARDHAIGLTAAKVLSKKGKGTRGVVTLLQRHKSHNKIAKKGKNSQSTLNVSRVELKSGLTRIARVIKGLPHVGDKRKNIALRRLERLNVSTRPIVKGGAAKQEAKK